jgi:hypothetical protein
VPTAGPRPRRRPDRTGELTYLTSSAYGGIYLLDQLWRQLNVDTIM